LRIQNSKIAGQSDGESRKDEMESNGKCKLDSRQENCIKTQKSLDHGSSLSDQSSLPELHIVVFGAKPIAQNAAS
jgi:hypothetical protein